MEQLVSNHSSGNALRKKGGTVISSNTKLKEGAHRDRNENILRARQRCESCSFPHAENFSERLMM